MNDAVKTIGFMPRRRDTSREAFRTYYEQRHAPLAVPLFPFRRYRRNHLADASVEPGFDCISEFWVSSLERIGELMAGEVGDTMRADERNFLDQPAIVAVRADARVAPASDGNSLLLLTRESGDDAALADACAAVGAGLDLLSPLDTRPPPFDAIVSVADRLPALPPGWKAGPTLAIDRYETDPATLRG